MKTRRIPPTAEKVYTYTLNRSANNENKPVAMSKQAGSGPKNKPAQPYKAAPAKSVNQDKTSTSSGKSRERMESNQNKSGNEEILAWGNTDEETQAFYDEMLEHESGDGEHNNTQTGDTDHKKNVDQSATGYAKTRFLNTNHEGDAPLKKDGNTLDKNSGNSTNDQFLEGDQETRNTPGYEA
jgi:hypothetical protein